MFKSNNIMEKINNTTLYYKIKYKDLPKKLKDIISVFEIPKIYVNIYEISSDIAPIYDFMTNNNIKYFQMNNSKNDLCICVENKISILDIISDIQFSEISIWDTYTSWSDFCHDSQNYDLTRNEAIKDIPHFFLSYNDYENNYLEIICDKSFFNENLKTKLSDIFN